MKNLTLLLLTFILVFSSCKKDELTITNCEEYYKEIKILNNKKIKERKYYLTNCWEYCKCDSEKLNNKFIDIEEQYNLDVNNLRKKYNCLN